MNKSRPTRLRQALLSLPFGLLFLLGSMMYPSPSWAWGDLGHKIIGEIGLQELNDKARTEVSRLIALDATFDSFTDACTWPDHPRRDPPQEVGVSPRQGDSPRDRLSIAPRPAALHQAQLPSAL